LLLSLFIKGNGWVKEELDFLFNITY